MGRPKLLLPWGESSVIGHLFWQWRRIGAAQIGVVCALGDAGMNAELDRLNFPKSERITNSKPERGMFSSIQRAATWDGWRPQITHWAIVLGDQPHLRIGTLQTVIDFSAANPDKICQPRKGGHRYHPVIMPRRAFQCLQNTTAADLKEFLQSFDAAYCKMDDSGLELDIDRPEDYQKALLLAKNK
jgi:molybdenum cofactor cytidylyltransferase